MDVLCRCHSGYEGSLYLLPNVESMWVFVTTGTCTIRTYILNSQIKTVSKCIHLNLWKLIGAQCTRTLQVYRWTLSDIVRIRESQCPLDGNTHAGFYPKTSDICFHLSHNMCDVMWCTHRFHNWATAPVSVKRVWPARVALFWAAPNPSKTKSIVFIKRCDVIVKFVWPDLYDIRAFDLAAPLNDTRHCLYQSPWDWAGMVWGCARWSDLNLFQLVDGVDTIELAHVPALFGE